MNKGKNLYTLFDDKNFESVGIQYLLTNPIKTQKKLNPILLGLEGLINEIKVFICFGQSHFPGNFFHYTYPIYSSPELISHLNQCVKDSKTIMIRNYFNQELWKIIAKINTEDHKINIPNDYFT